MCTHRPLLTYAKANALAPSRCYCINRELQICNSIQFNFFFFVLPFWILFKNYLDELFTYFQVDFIYGILNLFILMRSVSAAHYLVPCTTIPPAEEICLRS
jgi:hypothetical protein